MEITLSGPATLTLDNLNRWIWDHYFELYTKRWNLP